MKAFFKSLKRQDGFTLVELMVVVAIIGLLSAVAVPNFKKYQAKAKMTEAKLQLSALYTAETAFFSDFNIYASCLKYMGYDPSLEISNRYYAVGFTAGIGTITTAAHAAAVNSGLLSADCPAANTTAATGNAQTFFPAGKGVGAAIISSVALAAANAAGTAGTCTTASPTGGSCLGIQDGPATMNFIAAAIGYISQDAASGGAVASGIKIDNNKVITVMVNGF